MSVCTAQEKNCLLKASKQVSSVKLTTITSQVGDKQGSNFTKNYPDVFKGIGCFPGPLYYIQLDPSIIPEQTPCRPILVHLKEAFKQEIDRMPKAGVLKPGT